MNTPDITTRTGRNELRALRAAATPHRWRYMSDGGEDDNGIYADMPEHDYLLTEVSEWSGTKADAELVVAVVNLLPALLDLLDLLDEPGREVTDTSDDEYMTACEQFGEHRKEHAPDDSYQAYRVCDECGAEWYTDEEEEEPT